MRQRPIVSFVLATFNRGPILVHCLKKLLACGLPANQFEILVVDNASTDSTPDLVAREVPSATLIRLSKNGGPVAKNVAIRRSRGEFVVLLDDDAYPLPGAVPQMLRHFREDKSLGAAVFDVTLPDGSKEASAYPDVFIGAGTGLRRSVLAQTGLLPADFFMQAEEYDLSFRILQAGFSVQRFWDLPLTHLKTPGARIGQRTTCLDVRNNLYLLARYLPEPLCHQFAADWLSRYWMMATERDSVQAPHPSLGTHRKAFLRGSAQGLAQWSAKRAAGTHLLSPDLVERIFKFQKIRARMQRACERLSAKRIVFADFGKNMLAYHLAAQSLGLEVCAILDDNLGLNPASESCAMPSGVGAPLDMQASREQLTPRDYRGIPILPQSAFASGGGTGRGVQNWSHIDLVIVSNMSPVHAPRRVAALCRTLPLPVLDLFSHHDQLLHPTPTPQPSSAGS